MEVKPLQSENAFCPMLVTLEGIEIETKLEHPENLYAPMLVTFSPRIYLVTWLPNIVLKFDVDVQFWERKILLFIVTVAKLLQPENAFCPMLVTLEGMLMLVSPVQFANVFASMVFTLLGMDIDVNPGWS